MTTQPYQRLPIFDQSGRVPPASRRISPTRTRINNLLCGLGFVVLLITVITLLATNRTPDAAPSPPPSTPAPTPVPTPSEFCAAFEDVAAQDQRQVLACALGENEMSIEGTCLTNGVCQPDVTDEVAGFGSLFGANEGLIREYAPAQACLSDCTTQGAMCACAVRVCTRQVAGIPFLLECARNLPPPTQNICEAPTLSRDDDVVLPLAVTIECSDDGILQGVCEADGNCALSFAGGSGDGELVSGTCADLEIPQLTDCTGQIGSPCDCGGPSMDLVVCQRNYIIEGDETLIPNVIVECRESVFERNEDAFVTGNPASATVCSRFTDVALSLQPETSACDPTNPLSLAGSCTGVQGVCRVNVDNIGGNDIVGPTQSADAFFSNVFEFSPLCYSDLCTTGDSDQFCSCEYITCERDVDIDIKRFICTENQVDPDFICPIFPNIEASLTPIAADCNQANLVQGLCSDLGLCAFIDVNEVTFEVDPLSPCSIGELCLFIMVDTEQPFPFCSRHDPEFPDALPIVLPCSPAAPQE